LRAKKGVFVTATVLLRRLLQNHHDFDEAKQYAANHPYDQQFGVDTSGLIGPEDLTSGRQEDLYNAGYFGVPPSVFRNILHKIAIDFTRYTFVDLGSGKGRALLVASEYPFREIIGVELCPDLHSIAAANLARFEGQQACKEVRAVQANAADFAFPGGPLLIYMWNPFEAPILAAVLSNIEEALRRESRPILLAYIQPNLEAMLEESGFLKKLWREELPLSEEDYAAHAFPSRAETCTVFRSVTPAALG
jgi:SAM-dependent methyltransferase